MEKTIADMKVGERLFFGTYGVGQCAQPISWLKATRNNVFIAEYVLDNLIYDAREQDHPMRTMRSGGNANYVLSNILQFLNCEDDVWYGPTHEFDMPPSHTNPYVSRDSYYFHRPGFLNGFQAFEIESLSGHIHLPSLDDIISGRKYELFNRKGIRAKATMDVIANKRNHGWGEKSYAEFWTSSEVGVNRVSVVTRGGYADHRSPAETCGVRPICSITPNTKVESVKDLQGYRLIPFEATKKSEAVCTEEELSIFLGLL